MDLATAPVPPTLQEVASYGTQILTGMQVVCSIRPYSI